MFHAFAEGPNRQHIRVLDLQPDSNTATSTGARWRPGDPPPPPIVMHYVDGADCCTRNPERYRPLGMGDDEHRALVEAPQQRTSRSTRRALNAMPPGPKGPKGGPIGPNSPSDRKTH
jgi:hypothetical protein